jgi:hypothetical protein
METGDEVSISNFVDYSRILEVGRWAVPLPLKVYERAVHIVEEKYGRDANIEFTWRGIVATYQIPQEASRRRGFGVNYRRALAQAQHLEPALPDAGDQPEVGRARAIRAHRTALQIGADALKVAGALSQIAAAGNAPGPAAASLARHRHRARVIHGRLRGRGRCDQAAHDRQLDDDADRLSERGE